MFSSSPAIGSKYYFWMRVEIFAPSISFLVTPLLQYLFFQVTQQNLQDINCSICQEFSFLIFKELFFLVYTLPSLFSDHLRDVPWEDAFKLDASAAASEFSEWVQVGIDVYIPHRKY